jgi:ATP-dependent Clp protease protease subunit
MADLVVAGGDELFDKIFEENLKERKIILNQEITQDMVELIIMQILKWNKEDEGKDVLKRQTIKIYCNSMGGDVFTGLATIDAIKLSKTKVIGIVLGYAYSMGALIFLSTHKRYMMPNASLLIHDGQTSMSGSNNKVKDIQKFYAKIDDKMKEIVLNNSKITSEEYDSNVDRELYMLANECKEKGFCDCIVGQDCDLDEII